MDGVILFADDNIFNDTFEKKLFKELRKSFPVLGTHNLYFAETALSSIANITAFIVDWNFKRSIESEGEILNKMSDSPESLLINNQFYCLIYIYSESNIEDSLIGQKLTKKYGKRIKFRIKNVNIDLIKEKNSILKDIEKWKLKNQNLLVPHKWVQTLNKSAQSIFGELSTIDSNWINDIHKTAFKDGVDTVLEIINLFHFLLIEQIVQSKELRDTIKYLIESNKDKTTSNQLTFSKLYRRLYYNMLSNSDPIMTGDIFKIKYLKKNYWGIIITPECDVHHADEFDILIFAKNDFKVFVKDRIIQNGKLNSETRGKIRTLFNQSEMKHFFLPSFPFNKGTNKIPASIDFSRTIKVNRSKLKLANRYYKLNSPYIQQLRQRYLSYQGRIGVPAIPRNLKDFSISSINFD